MSVYILRGAVEIMFTLWSMLATLTLYTYVIGEVSNIVMANDQALVSMREEFMRVQRCVS